MAIENAKTLNVRIRNKYDSYEAWASSSLVLEAGEIAVAYTTVNVDIGNGKIEKHPELLMKVGDGTNTFDKLPWLSAKAADVAAWAKAANKPTYEAKEITGIGAYIAEYVDQELGISVDTDTQYQIVKVDDYNYKLQCKGKGETAWADVADSVIVIPNDTAAIEALQGLVGEKSVAEQIATTIANYSTTDQMNKAIAAAKGEAVSHADGLNTAMNTRVEALEAIDHDHGNKTVLDGITAEKVAAWDAAEQNAKDHADDLDEAMDGRVAALEAKFGSGEGNVESQIAAAVAAEAKLREDADKALQDEIGVATAEGVTSTGLHARIEGLEALVGDDKVSDAIAAAVKVEKERAEGIEGGLETRLAAVEGDYLKAADKTELQNQINTIMNNPDTEGVINSINEFTQYISDHGEIAEGFRTDIDANKEAIEVLNGDASTAGSVDKKIADAIAAENLSQYATDGELSTLADRVTAVEGDLNTEASGLKAKMAAAEADIDALETKVGDKTVAAQIEAAIEALKIGDYAKASDLTAAINQHNADKTALEAEIAKKANDADLAAIAKTGSTDDLVQGEMTLVFDCGTSAV